jgi:CheY-like chemotaxis protein
MQVPEEWKVIADAVPGLLAYLDTDRRMMIANSHCKEWLGCDGDGVIGRRFDDVLDPRGFALLAPHLERAAAGLDCVFDANLPTPAGPRPARISLLPHLDPPGRPKGYTAVMLDLLDRATADGHRDDGTGAERSREARTGKPETGLDGIAREFGEVLTSIGAHAEACLGLLDARHPLVASLREIRADLDRAASLSRRVISAAAGAADGSPARSAEVPSRPEDFSGKPVVLLAEDEDAVRNLVARVLENAGYCVLPAASGAAALELATAHPGTIDLLLTDVVMAGMGGRDLAQRLRPSRPDMPVIYMSGFTDDWVLRHRLESESIAFLPKPFAPSTLVQKVREALAPAGRPR